MAAPSRRTPGALKAALPARRTGVASPAEQPLIDQNRPWPGASRLTGDRLRAAEHGTPEQIERFVPATMRGEFQETAIFRKVWGRF